MKSNYKKLAPYIRLVDKRNTADERYELLGVSVDKHFIKSIANTVGTDWRTYKIIKRGQFCYIPDTSRRGDKMGIALLTDYDIALVSQAYAVFEIIDKEELLPEYLNLWFKRPEFDRYARFHSHGSVREIFDWEEMGNVELPIPSIEEQKAIVNAYQTIENRIILKRKINDNLVEQSITLFRQSLISTSADSLIHSTVANLGEFVRGKNLTASEMCNGTIPVISAGLEPSGFHNIANVKSPTITISGSGVNAGYVSFHAEDIWASDCSYCNKSEFSGLTLIMMPRYY